jgi:hypothetical protein
MPATAKVPAAAGATATIDLDARRAARLERSGPKIVRQGGRDWEFKPELPLTVIEAFQEGDLRAAFAQLLADPDDAADFLSVGLSMEDFRYLLEAVYGADRGKSQPSISP